MRIPSCQRRRDAVSFTRIWTPPRRSICDNMSLSARGGVLGEKDLPIKWKFFVRPARGDWDVFRPDGNQSSMRVERSSHRALSGAAGATAEDPATAGLTEASGME